MNNIKNSLRECVQKKDIDAIKSIEMSPELVNMIDFDYLEEHSGEEPEWFKDKRIGKWSDFVQSLTRKNLDDFNA